MTNFLLILILLVIVLGPLGLIVGFGIGAVLLVIAVISLPLLLLVRLVTASEKALRREHWLAPVADAAQFAEDPAPNSAGNG